MWKYQNTDELYHYGVLGMKWGQHKYGDKYVYKSLGQRYQEHKLKAFTNKMNKHSIKSVKKEDKYYKKTHDADNKRLEKIKSRVKQIKQRDKNRQDYVKTTSVGKQIVRDILLGPIFAGSYARYRAAGRDAVDALSKTISISSIPILASKYDEHIRVKKQLEK